MTEKSLNYIFLTVIHHVTTGYVKRDKIERGNNKNNL